MKAQERAVRQLQVSLDQIASPKSKAWWEKYLRHVIPFRGVGIPAIRKQLSVWREEHGIAAWALKDQLNLALRLFESPIAEDKLAGILYLQNYLYDKLDWEVLLEKYEELYLENLIFDWNTCDWFCVRVLGPTIAKNGPPCAAAIAAWHRADNLWQARSSVVSFVPVSAESRYHPLILNACAVLIRRDERFAKTAVGWILRDVSRHDEDTVREFVQNHLNSFSIESLRNACKYFDKNERRAYVQKLKAA